MTRTPEFVHWILERLEGLGPLRSRAMFGGHGIWLDEGIAAAHAEEPAAGRPEAGRPETGPPASGRPRRRTGAQGLFFALIADDVLYLKADGETRAFFEDAGLAPFRPFPDRSVTMAYYPVPDEVLEDGETLLEWANLALGAALRARPGRARPGRGHADTDSSSRGDTPSAGRTSRAATRPRKGPRGARAPRSGRSAR
ncbi:MAG: TfoX/Sxy family protein [Pseudomonadales bacterium]|nr:TfoX/Sxy family protein [Pseudomonadales bacterium]